MKTLVHSSECGEEARQGNRHPSPSTQHLLRIPQFWVVLKTPLWRNKRCDFGLEHFKIGINTLTTGIICEQNPQSNFNI